MKVLTISNIWGFDRIKTMAISASESYVTKKLKDPIAKLKFAQRMDIPQWAFQTYAELTLRVSPLSADEAKEVGFETAYKIGLLREKTKDWDRSSRRSPDDLKDLISEVFGIDTKLEGNNINPIKSPLIKGHRPIAENLERPSSGGFSETQERSKGVFHEQSNISGGHRSGSGVHLRLQPPTSSRGTDITKVITIRSGQMSAPLPVPFQAFEVLEIVYFSAQGCLLRKRDRVGRCGGEHTIFLTKNYNFPILTMS